MLREGRVLRGKEEGLVGRARGKGEGLGGKLMGRKVGSDWVEQGEAGGVTEGEEER